MFKTLSGRLKVSGPYIPTSFRVSIRTYILKMLIDVEAI